MYLGLHVKCLLFLQILMTVGFSRQICEKCSNIKFRGKPYIGSRVVPWEQQRKQADRQTDMTKLIVAFRNFANAPEISTLFLQCILCFIWISGQTAYIYLHSINWLDFVSETECVYCAVRTGSLTIIHVTFSLLSVCVTAHAVGRLASNRRKPSWI